MRRLREDFVHIEVDGITSDEIWALITRSFNPGWIRNNLIILELQKDMTVPNIGGFSGWIIDWFIPELNVGNTYWVSASEGDEYSVGSFDIFREVDRVAWDHRTNVVQFIDVVSEIMDDILDHATWLDTESYMIEKQRGNKV